MLVKNNRDSYWIWIESYWYLFKELHGIYEVKWQKTKCFTNLDIYHNNSIIWRKEIERERIWETGQKGENEEKQWHNEAEVEI